MKRFAGIVVILLGLVLVAGAVSLISPPVDMPGLATGYFVVAMLLFIVGGNLVRPKVTAGQAPRHRNQGADFGAEPWLGANIPEPPQPPFFPPQLQPPFFPPPQPPGHQGHQPPPFVPPPPPPPQPPNIPDFPMPGTPGVP